MSDLGFLLIQAKAGDQTAYGEIVGQFQDMAVGYAYAVLGEAYLAEDAAQEAFIEAWRFLPRVYGPASFPAWLRSIVFKQCDRMTRGKKPDIVPLAYAESVASLERGPAERLVQQEIREIVHQAIQQLTGKEREVTLLFYISEYNYQEIAGFLDIPVKTVKSRLHTARGKLRERMISIMKEQLHEQAPSRNPAFREKVLDQVYPVVGESTVIGTLYPVLKAAGVEKSQSYLMGVLGHAFSFIMNKDGGEVWQPAALDWQLFWDRLGNLGYRFNEFQAILKGSAPAPSTDELKALKEQTWEAVTSGIDSGIPSIAWQPMTVELRDKGIGAFEWGLLVGYDTENKTYAVRHPRDKTEFTVSYDGFGYTDPINWYYVLAPGEPVEVDQGETALQALRDAVAFARGTRYAMADICYPTDALGLAAYELWLEALRSKTANLDFTSAHAWNLSTLRRHAAEFLGEIIDHMPATSHQALDRAKTCYEQEAAALEALAKVCQEAPDEQSTEAADHLQAALDAERGAVEVIEQVLEDI